MIKIGDVISIPLQDRIVTGKVIYLSTILKDVFGFVVLPQVFTNQQDIDIQDGAPVAIKLPKDTRMVLYADIKAVTERKIWPIVGHLPVTDANKELLLHGVGGSLYQGNDTVKTFESLEERRAYPQILTSGDEAIVNILSYFYANN